MPERAPQAESPPLLSRVHALYLDFDGTLAELAPRPDRVRIQRELPGLLLALREQLRGAVAIITGRNLAILDKFLEPVILPGAGLHGAELRTAGMELTPARKPPGMDALAQALRERFAGVEGVLVEDKGAGVALHFRLAPAQSEACIGAMRQLASNPELEVITGNRVVEARARDANKGNALRVLAGHAPFAGRPPAFVGDDVTDEDGFRAAAELGGYGVKVGTDASAARYRCIDVNEVHDWLRSSLHGLEYGG
jgi:trehalose 6-phosphate phosphatase